MILKMVTLVHSHHDVLDDVHATLKDYSEGIYI